MELAVEIDAATDGLTILTLKGGVDLYAAPRLRECLTVLTEKGCRELVVDLSQVQFLGIAGRQILAEVHAQASAVGGYLWLVSPPRSTAFPEELSSVFRIFGSVAEARGEFSGGGQL